MDETLLKDVLIGLMRFCDRMGINFGEQLHIAFQLYAIEEEETQCT